jgi:hypothetical protein
MLRRMLLVLTAGGLMVATLAATAGIAFARINECPPQQQPTGELTVCTRGGEGGPGGGSGGQLTGSFDPQTTGQFSAQQRGGGANPGDATGGGGGNRSTDVNFQTGSGTVDAAGGNSATGGGHCGLTFEGGVPTGGFEHGRSCPDFLLPG